jgi:2-polyprenyl-6-methoxyphenol hydroxylase-like FAD-dependent oxidoreductase
VTRIENVVVVGGGIGGLCTALWLGDRGYRVTVVERDDISVPDNVEEAWSSWDRSGAPQVRFPHIVMARLCSLLREDQPDVYRALVGTGAAEVPFTDFLTPDSADYEPEPGDEELTAVRSRRTTVEWVLRKAALAHDRVEFRGRTVVAGLIAEPGPVPHVTGVRLADGTQIDADLTVVSAGKRCKLPTWFSEIGAAELQEESSESGVSYVCRFYRLPEGREFDRDAAAVLTEGYLQGGIIEADNGTFGASLTVPRVDNQLRRMLLEPGNLERVMRELPQYAPFADLLSDPISDVAAMAGTTNRWRELLVDGEPLATGVVPIGDSVICTNPLYGRGMSTSAWSVDMLAKALDDHADDHRALVTTYATAVDKDLKPWYLASVQMDEASQREAEAVFSGDDGDAAVGTGSIFARLLALMRYDAVVQRAFMRSINLLASPNALMEDPELIRRIGELMERHPDAANSGHEPATRDDLIALLTNDRDHAEEAHVG